MDSKNKYGANLKRLIHRAIKVLSNIPLFGILFHYDLATHKAAGIKFLIFWFVSLVPFICGAVIQPSTSEFVDVEELFLHFREQFRSASALAYTISFITPMVYLVLTRINLISEYAQLEEIIPPNKNLPKGINLTIFIAFCLIACAIVTYTANYTQNTKWIIWKLMYNQNLIYLLYVMSLVLWYISMLIDLFDKDPKSNFVAKNQAEANEFSDSLSKRLNTTGESL